MPFTPVSFFGLTVDPKKKYSQTVEDDFHITMASLGSKLPENAERTSLIMSVDDREFVLCSLTPGKIENQPLNLTITEGEEIAFYTTGNCPIDITGNHVAFEDHGHDHDDDDEEGMFDDEDDEDEDGRDSEMLEGEDDDDEDDEDEGEEEELDEEAIEAILKANAKAGKRKPEPIPKESNNKKAKIVEVVEEPTPAPEQSKKQAKKEEAAAASAKKEAQAKKETPKESPAKKEAVSPAKRTLPSGLVVEDTVVGTGARATNNKKVSVRYIGRLSNGKVFDSNTKGAPFSFKLGKGEVIKGWDLGVEGMNVGGSRKLTIPAALAYGKRGAAPDIPPNATLTFEVKLLDVKN
ncbi:hypothetical protein BC831DRAFT_418418 [Entophlyctis helioformis]|nr:hypothetical protein BC831DRAFT_418418 [Entophlyctis helioformis]